MDETMNTNMETAQAPAPAADPTPADPQELHNDISGEAPENDTENSAAREVQENADGAEKVSEETSADNSETADAQCTDAENAETENTEAENGAEYTGAASNADPLIDVLMHFCDMARKDMTEREEAALQRGMERIRALDPSISSVGDLFAMEGNEVFYDMVVKHGIELDTAYKAVCFDRLMQRAQASGAQEERNRSHARAHLERTRSRGTPSDSVPPEIMAIYRAMNPQASEAEIVRHYNHTK